MVDELTQLQAETIYPNYQKQPKTSSNLKAMYEIFKWKKEHVLKVGSYYYNMEGYRR